MKCQVEKKCLFPNTCSYNKQCMQNEINKAERRRKDNNAKKQETYRQI